MRARLPRPRARALPSVEELLVELREAGVDGAPEEGPGDALRAVLLLASDLALLRKRIDFAGFSWDDPGFVAVDAKVRVDVRYAAASGASRDDLRATLLSAMARARGGLGLVALDLRAAGAREFEVAHALFGEVTLFAHRHRP